MNYWVFKATPKGEHAYDYTEELRVGHEEKWNSAKGRDPMRVGDRVFFWATGDLLHLAGLGVVTQVYPQRSVRVRYLTKILPNPPPIEDLKAHPAFTNTRFFKPGSYGTEHLLTEAEAKALYGLVVARNPAAAIWPDGSDAPVTSGATNLALFEIGAKFSDGVIRLKQAREQLVKLGINPSSATNYLYNSRHLLAGSRYMREMTIAPTEGFLNWIKAHRSRVEYQNSLQALEAHLQYLEGLGKRRPKHQELLARLSSEALANEKRPSKIKPSDSARDDLPEGPPPGCADPKQTTRTVTAYPRIPAVRDYVLKQAKGRCEYCGDLGFPKPNGEPYLEAHHLLALSEDGPDTPENVVALCANHHREAHYGHDRAKLETAVLMKRKGGGDGILGI